MNILKTDRVFGMELELMLLMLSGINLLLLLKVNAARHKLTTAVEKDAEGVDCLPNATIFKQRTLMGSKTTAWNEFSSTMASAVTCLATNQKFNFSKYIFESMVKNLDNAGKILMYPSLERAATTATSLDAEQDRGNINKTQSKATLNELSSLGTSSGSGPRRQETMRDTIALNWVGLSRRVEFADEEGLGEEDVSKQGRIADIDADAGINLVSIHFDVDTYMFIVHDLVSVGVVETKVASKYVNLSVDEVTLAQALATLKITAASTRPKAKGLVIHEEEQETTPTVSFQQPSQVKVQDKGKGKMVEPENPMKKKELIRFDEEIALKLQAKFDEEVRLARKKAKKEEEANIVSWDNVQAMIDVDYQMAQQMQAEEQEKLSIEEKSKLFVQLLKARKKHFAAMRAQ
ncbi:hypothetical protein Tco_0701735 [Tanacetum coccineum]